MVSAGQDDNRGLQVGVSSKRRSDVVRMVDVGNQLKQCCREQLLLTVGIAESIPSEELTARLLSTLTTLFDKAD